jgi:hypothetical protein
MKKPNAGAHADPGSCGCQHGNEPTKSPSIDLKRLEAAIRRADHLLAEKIAAASVQLSDAHVHIFERGFGVGAWKASDSRLVFAGVGVVDRMPTEATLTFDLSFFNGLNPEHPDVLWLELEALSPVPRIVKLPLRGTGVLRDPATGHLLKVDAFEVATDLVTDLGDIAVVIACVLACVGLFCAALCATLCVAVIACVACLAACVGSRLPQFLICVRACGIAVDDIQDALP